MNPLSLLPHRIAVLHPEIRIGAASARRMVSVRQALEYLRTGMYRQEFSASGEFLGLMYAPQNRKVRPQYIPEEMPPFEVPNVKFIQPNNTTPSYLRTVTQFAF